MTRIAAGGSREVPRNSLKSLERVVSTGGPGGSSQVIEIYDASQGGWCTSLLRRERGLRPAPSPVGDGKGLLDLARRVARLQPSHRDPERFHEEKSEIAHALRELAKEAGRG